MVLVKVMFGNWLLAEVAMGEPIVPNEEMTPPRLLVQLVNTEWVTAKNLPNVIMASKKKIAQFSKSILKKKHGTLPPPVANVFSLIACEVDTFKLLSVVSAPLPS